MTLVGSGTLAVRMRQAHSMPVLVNAFKESQQPAVGVMEPPLLPVMKLRHGVNVEIMEEVHGVLIICWLFPPNIKLDITITTISVNLPIFWPGCFIIFSNEDGS